MDRVFEQIMLFEILFTKIRWIQGELLRNKF